MPPTSGRAFGIDLNKAGKHNVARRRSAVPDGPQFGESSHENPSTASLADATRWQSPALLAFVTGRTIVKTARVLPIESGACHATWRFGNVDFRSLITTLSLTPRGSSLAAPCFVHLACWFALP